MSDYVKSTNFAIKDGLTTTDPAKVIKGTDIDNEYNAIANAIASKANTNSPALTGTPTAPTATAGTNTTQIASCAFVLANAIPSGIISMWSGTIASIPSGWYLCDGSNSTPDLRDKFIIGAKQDETSIAKTNVTGALTQSGGSKDAIAVSHTHTASSTDSGHTHYLPGSNWVYNVSGGGQALNIRGDYGATSAAMVTNPNTSTGTANISTTVNSAGSSGTNANLPPYYALAFIMKA